MRAVFHLKHFLLIYENHILFNCLGSDLIETSFANIPHNCMHFVAHSVWHRHFDLSATICAR